MRKKSQVIGQVFIFILAAVLAVLIIAYGYKAIQVFILRTDEIALVNFKTDLQSEIRTISSLYGDKKTIELAIPGKYQMLCLLDIDYNDKGSTCLCSKNFCVGNEEEYQPEVCDAWETPGNQDNAFLVPISPIKLSKLKLENGYLCITPRGATLSLVIEGKGDSTAVSRADIAP